MPTQIFWVEILKIMFVNLLGYEYENRSTLGSRYSIWNYLDNLNEYIW